MLDAVARYLPSPEDMSAVEGEVPQPAGTKKAPRTESRQPSSREPFLRIGSSKCCRPRPVIFTGLRVYSGQLKANSRVLNSTRDKKGEHCPTLAHSCDPQGTGGPGCRGGHRRHRRSDRSHVIRSRGTPFASLSSPFCWIQSTFPETVISMAIEPETATERKKLGEALEMNAASGSDL